MGPTFTTDKNARIVNSVLHDRTAEKPSFRNNLFAKRGKGWGREEYENKGLEVSLVCMLHIESFHNEGRPEGW